jgi:hypothetical protein
MKKPISEWSDNEEEEAAPNTELTKTRAKKSIFLTLKNQNVKILKEIKK